MFEDYVARETVSGKKYRFFSGVPYLGTGRSELMDLYLPEGNAPRPAVLVIHGGGWSAGGRGGQRETEFAEFFAELGYAAASIDYALTRWEGRPFEGKKAWSSWPVNIYDCKTALRFLRKYSRELGVDSSRLATIGGSAGGHLALLSGVKIPALDSGGLYNGEKNGAKCVMDFYGIPDVRKWGGYYLMGETPDANPREWALASPVEHLSEDFPPVLVVHGTRDEVVDFRLSKEFVGRLREKNVKHTFIPVEGAAHSFALNPPRKDLRPAVRKFLEENL